MQKAKARLTELVKACQDGPQIITVRGKEVAVVINIDDYDNIENNRPNLVDFLSNCPLYKSSLNFKRDKSLPRNVKI